MMPSNAVRVTLGRRLNSNGTASSWLYESPFQRLHRSSCSDFPNNHVCMRDVIAAINTGKNSSSRELDVNIRNNVAETKRLMENIDKQIHVFNTHLAYQQNELDDVTKDAERQKEASRRNVQIEGDIRTQEEKVGEALCAKQNTETESNNNQTRRDVIRTTREEHGVTLYKCIAGLGPKDRPNGVNGHCSVHEIREHFHCRTREEIIQNYTRPRLGWRGAIFRALDTTPTATTTLWLVLPTHRSGARQHMTAFMGLTMDGYTPATICMVGLECMNASTALRPFSTNLSLMRIVPGRGVTRK